MTAFGDSRLVVKAIQEGAYNYLDKPFPLDAAKNMVERAVESIRFRNQAEFLISEGPNMLLGSSNEMDKVRETIKKIAQHPDISVLLRGESGTGKEVAARMIHSASASQRVILSPLTALRYPKTLLEAELFGYQKGAYTGADSDKQGLIEIADKGTLFLDEIGDMPRPPSRANSSVSLTRDHSDLGEHQRKKVSLNLICATCVDLSRNMYRKRSSERIFSSASPCSR